MTAPTENQKLELALQKFEDILRYRGDMYLRLAKRVRVFVRGGMVMVSLLAFALSILLYTLATRLEHAAETTKKLENNVTLVGTNMTEMKQLIANMEKRMQVMEHMQKNLSGITSYTDDMVQDMKYLNYSMTKMQKRLSHIDGSLKNMSNSVSNIGDSVKKVGHDVDELAKPSSPFNMMPTP